MTSSAYEISNEAIQLGVQSMRSRVDIIMMALARTESEEERTNQMIEFIALELSVFDERLVAIAGEATTLKNLADPNIPQELPF